MSYSPKTGLVYIPAMEYPLIYGDATPFEIHPGRWNTGVVLPRSAAAAGIAGGHGSRGVRPCTQ